eukprot:jgi/Botrbrau1/2551/Bobra.0079s0038.1
MHQDAVLTLKLHGRPRRSPPLHHGYYLPTNDGSCSQYLAWSPDSRYLAASSDTNRTVTVWDVRAKQEGPMSGPQTVLPNSNEPPSCQTSCPPFLALEGFYRPVLAVSFVPCCPTLFVCAEDHMRITLVDVEAGPRSLQVLSSCPDPLGGRFHFGRIAGLRVTQSGRLLALVHARPPSNPGTACDAPAHDPNAQLYSSPAGLVAFNILRKWTRESHVHFPLLLRQAAQTLLAGTAAKETGPNASGLSRLPTDMVANITEAAAFPVAAWMVGHVRRPFAPIGPS